MTGRTGYTALDNTDPMQGPAQITDVYEHFDPLIGETVTTASSLPTTGNWKGRAITALDTGILWVNLDGNVSWRAIGGSLIAARLRTTIAHTTSATASTATPIQWDTTDYNYGGVYATGQKTRLTAPVKGIYGLTANLAYGTNAYAGGVALAKNGVHIADTDRWMTASAQSYAYPSITTDLLLNAGDYIEIESLGGAPSLGLNVTLCNASMILRNPV